MFSIIFFSTLLATVSLGLVGANPALAQEGDLPKDGTCIDCHQDQYQLYDSGKWYCLCKTNVRCTECHAGRKKTI
jgi:hypothetical protein